MDYKITHLPLIKLIVPFLWGILFFKLFTFPFLTGLWIAMFSLIVLFYSHFSLKHILTKNLNTIAVTISLFLTGGLMVTNNQLINREKHFSTQKGEFALGIISKPLEEKDKSYRTVIRIKGITDSSDKLKQSDGNLLIYLQKDSKLAALEPGDEVLFHLNYNKLTDPVNPGQFNYKNYLGYKSIFHQQYITAHEISITRKHISLVVQRISNNIGLYVQSVLRKYIPEKENFSLADGILLGHRADIDIELYNAFAYTGILHILSVSGLHVGIIYGMLLFLLSFIKDKNRKIKIGKFIFIFLFIWLFTFVTGFSAACVRAAILFSLLNYGKLSKEHVSNLNLLAGAALLQLLIDPNNLFDIGFQLSYLAMLGLFIFYKPIYALYFHPNKFIDWTWKLWSASIAAQLFTVPLSIYYFGNFPTYFLFANIFAIPMSAVILWLSIALLPFSIIPPLAHLIGWLDSLVISLFIQLTYFFSNLPMGKLYNLYISKVQLVALLSAILCLTFFTILRRPKYLLACLSLFLITILVSYAYNIQQIKKDEIVLYSIPKNLVIAVNKNDKQFLFLKDSLTERAFSFSIKNSYRAFRINRHQTYLLDDSLKNENIYADKNMMYTHGISFYFINRENNRKIFSPTLKTDYLFLTDNCYLNIESLQTNYKFKYLLLSGDNDKRHIRIYKKLLKENGIKFIDLSEKAYIIGI